MSARPVGTTCLPDAGREGPGPVSEVTRAFLIADLSGYTALTEAHGGNQAAQVVTRFSELAEATVAPGVRLVERVGDELLLVGAEASALVRTAVALREAVEKEPLFPAVRAGLHLGPVLEQGGRYFGSPLNLTARVAAYARAGQILATTTLAAAAAGLPVEFRPLGAVRFKNVSGSVALVEIVEANHAEPGLDPVCRMQVQPESTPAQLSYNGRTLHFCSLACLQAIAGRPDDYEW